MEQLSEELHERIQDLFRECWGEPERPAARDWRAKKDEALSMVMHGPKRGSLVQSQRRWRLAAGVLCDLRPGLGWKNWTTTLGTPATCRRDSQSPHNGAQDSPARRLARTWLFQSRSRVPVQESKVTLLLMSALLCELAGSMHEPSKSTSKAPQR